jgi:DNA-binding MarR family transcriptional regulator
MSLELALSGRPEENRIQHIGDGPRPANAEVRLFAALESGTDESQAALSKRVGAAVGLVNALLKRAVRKGYVKMTSAPARRYTYYLTPKGFAEKSRLVAEYLNYSLSFFREARGEYAALFAAAARDGARRLVLVGGGDLAEIAALAAMETDVALVAIVDSATNQHRMAGIEVVKTIGDAPAFDAIVITEANAPQAAHDSIRAQFPQTPILCPAVLQVATERPLAKIGKARAVG